MNFLQLVNRTRQECGVSSIALSALSGLAAADQRIKDWVANAWADLQLAHTDWQFMQGPFTFTTVNNQFFYTPTQAGAPDVADWKRDSFRCYTTASGFADEQILPFMADDVFRDVYQFGSMRTTLSRPVVFTIDPSTRGLSIGPVPLVGYTILGLYYNAPTALVADADDPSTPGNDLPTRWHMLLVWMAAQSYAAYEAAAEVKQRADENATRMMEQLEIEQLPGITFGPSLA